MQVEKGGFSNLLNERFEFSMGIVRGRPAMYFYHDTASAAATGRV